MPCADFLQLPMHAGRALIVNLHPIHADVALARIWILCHDARQRNETAPIERPTFLDGKIQQGRRFCRERLRPAHVWRERPGIDARGWRVEFMNDFLAWTALDDFRFRMA